MAATSGAGVLLPGCTLREMNTSVDFVQHRDLGSDPSCTLALWLCPLEPHVCLSVSRFLSTQSAEGKEK